MSCKRISANEFKRPRIFSVICTLTKSELRNMKSTQGFYLFFWRNSDEQLLQICDQNYKAISQSTGSWRFLVKWTRWKVPPTITHRCKAPCRQPNLPSAIQAGRQTKHQISFLVYSSKVLHSWTCTFAVSPPCIQNKNVQQSFSPLWRFSAGMNFPSCPFIHTGSSRTLSAHLSDWQQLECFSLEPEHIPKWNSTHPLTPLNLPTHCSSQLSPQPHMSTQLPWSNASLAFSALINWLPYAAVTPPASVT